ncbi:glucose-1-phosphate adenylyltransferase [Nitriliruptor alkaliphilus]|uniref:glucose-1-phosphate adenylyltransferase n=1 Tax=Nitriliruptor alkaliphilus TaxID=427918 RepID=UPI000695BA09|nr:glucose-1-phosphate adenylyltransferase [Nitriliruptor alkaliphilus]
MARQPNVLGVVLAGGEGRRLAPLTRDRAKPAVPFGGNYRLVDFALSNLVNSGFRRIIVLTQYKSHSLDTHLAKTWRMSPMLGNFVAPVPAQMRTGRTWFQGSADALFQNINIIRDEDPDYICVFGADNLYRMDASQMLDEHIASGAGVTVAGLRVPVEQAYAFGVIEPGENGRIRAFHEKPSDAVGLEDDPSQVFASMGNYIFTTEALIDAVRADAADESSAHDMGGNIITEMVGRGDAAVHDFLRDNDVPGATDRDRGYWRDVGTVDAYHEAHMDLISVHPIFNLYNLEWPIYSWHDPLPPAKFVFDEADRRGVAVDSMICSGVVVSGGTVRRSVVSPGAHVHTGASVEESVLLHGVDVGRGAVVRRAIVDKNVRIPAGTRIGVDPEQDRARFHVSDGGIVVIGKGDHVPGPGSA